jgi:hypothetical protein
VFRSVDGRVAPVSCTLIGRKRARMFYLDHVESDGCFLFEQVLRMDLEGIVCNRNDSPYKVTEKPSRIGSR